MPVIIPQIKCSLSQSRESAVGKALRSAGLSGNEILSADIYKTSLDARDQKNILFVHSVILTLKDPALERRVAERCGAKLVFSEMPKIVSGCEKQRGRIIVTGFGPAGMFCALMLAENGYRPLVLERGGSVEQRTQKIMSFWNGGPLDDNTNVQFGEGGAGTFSDGKLMTRIKDPLCRYVFERLHEFGAPDEIMTKAKAHIGTDKLRGIVKAVRERIISLGGEVRFNTALEELRISGGEVTGVRAGGADIEASALVLAIGHSARDTFEMLLKSGVKMESKPFAVGARIEHLQSAVEQSLYGRAAGNPLLPRGEYQMSFTQKDGQSCYTFCMCPGGVVVPAASEQGGVVVNGMSEFARSGSNANAAVVCAVNKNDFGSGVLDGMRFAEEIERRAFSPHMPYSAPVMTVSAFLEGKEAGRSVAPSYAIGVYDADLGKILPERVCKMMRKGLRVFAGRMGCFKDGGALLTAPETRTSSPVRLLRESDMRSVGVSNLYPCGEGAGYAGGITSSAVDGVRAAMKIAERFSPD